MRYLVFISILMVAIFAKDIEPYLKIDVNASAKDLVLVEDNKIAIGCDDSSLKVYDYINKKFTKVIKLPKIKDFMGDIIDTRASSIDYLNGKYLILSDSGVGGYSDLRIFDNELKDIFSEKDKLAIIKAKFIDDTHILLGFLSNEVALYDVKNKKFLYRIQLNESRFSDFALNEDKSLVAFACESGEVTVVQVKDGKIVKKLSGANLDNIFSVDFKKDIVSCGGKDRRASWYNIKSGKSDYILAKFFVYATALSPDSKMIAFTLDEKNNITIINRETKEKKYILKGQKSTLNTIIFKDKDTLFSASDDNIVIMWKLK